MADLLTIVEDHPKIALGIAGGLLLLLVLHSAGKGTSSSPEALAAQLAGQKLTLDNQLALAKTQTGAATEQAKIQTGGATSQARIQAGAQTAQTRIAASSADLASKLSAQVQTLQTRTAGVLGRLSTIFNFKGQVANDNANVAIGKAQSDAQSNSGLFGSLGLLGLALL